jgi:leucyl-tRNA synthetase
MFEALRYRKRSTVNWCSKDYTVLANEQVVDYAAGAAGR